MSTFVEWLDGELRSRHWSFNELARQAGLSSSGVSQVMTEQQRPGVEFCRGVAEALRVPAAKVFRLAGLLPPEPERDEVVEEILYYYDRMDGRTQENFRMIARALGDGGEGMFS